MVRRFDSGGRPQIPLRWKISEEEEESMEECYVLLADNGADSWVDAAMALSCADLATGSVRLNRRTVTDCGSGYLTVDTPLLAHEDGRAVETTLLPPVK